MKCHYEVLDVPKDANETDIKTSYRKLALKWHPDKNLDNPEYAKEQFQIVQQAYEVLSDRQERAWYDKHREQILYGGNSEFQDESLDLFQYFTTTCFKGYGDDEQGFYTVYRDVFEKVAQEDMEFMENKNEFCEIPNFGDSKTSFEKVAEFYAYWSAYTTKKSYVWLDPININEIKDRRYVKLIEKENKKIRQKAKKERNDEIRNLVAFIKKRDKRVQAQKKLQEQKLLEDKKKREHLSKQKRLERQKLLTSETRVQPDWAKFDNVKSELEEIEKSLAEEFGEELSNSESDDESLNNLYCVACNKVFKTPKAFQNHESSKKHKENVEYLKSSLQEDEFEESNTSDNTDDYIEVDNEKNSDIDEQIAESIKEIASESEEIDVDDIEEIKVKQKRKKKQKNVMVFEEETIDDSLRVSSSDDDFKFEESKKQKKRNKKNTNKAKVKEINENCDNEAADEEVDIKKETNKQKKSKVKKAMKEKFINEVGDIDINHNCVTCKSVFPSKNKLFDHLKKTGHGVYLPTNVKNQRKKDIKES